MTNFIDKIVAWYNPQKGVERANARQILAAYEAAKPTRTRRNLADNRNGDSVSWGAYETLRGQARHLDQNHDLARGTLNALVNNVVGAKGIGVEFQPKSVNGEIHKEFAEALQSAYKNWAKRPDTTGEYSWAKSQRLLARGWFRDGESLSRALMGPVPSYRHLSEVPFSIELLESDFLTDIDDEAKKIFQGVQRNDWGRPTNYLFYKHHPGDIRSFNLDTKMVRAADVNHIKMVDRIRQARGVSIFASVMNRLNDLKDYEEAERVAARLSAMMVAYIKKGSGDSYIPPDGDTDPRTLPFSPGMTFDNLMAGEEVGTIESNRPSALLQPFRDSMLKAIASGTCASYSTISKNYDGTYSAQRQELVEQWSNYAVLSDDFITMEVEPTTQRFIQIATLSNAVQIPPDVDRSTLYDVEYICPSMPWIDPAKEAKGHETRLALKLKSPQQIIRAAGDKPEEVLDQVQRWNEELVHRGLTIEPTEDESADIEAPTTEEPVAFSPGVLEAHAEQIKLANETAKAEAERANELQAKLNQLEKNLSNPETARELDVLVAKKIYTNLTEEEIRGVI